MLHSDRRWSVSPVESPPWLAETLTGMVWCGCTGFRIGYYHWLNDSTSPDAIQEYAVIKRNGPSEALWQLESITFGWCSKEEALEYISQTLAGEDDNRPFRHEVAPIIESPSQHGRCPHCA